MQIHKASRRAVIKVAGAAAAMALCPKVLAEQKVREPRIISRDADHYHGWPTVARRKDGELLLVYSGGREAHVCPFGRVEMMRSLDGGKSWTEPQIVLDTPMDDRDAGVLETSKGTILVTTFTSLAYETVLAAGEKGGWSGEKLARWRAARDRLTPEQRQAGLGVWMLRSTDGGKTWSKPYDSLVNSPHGPIQLADGRLLYAGKDLWRKPYRVGVCESADDGQTWRWLAELPARKGDSSLEYHELHAAEVGDGRLIVHVRNENKANHGETLQSESSDGGKTWSEPHSIGVWGLPSHLLKLADGRLLMTYGYRRKPFGVQARTSEDGGRSWSGAIVLSADGSNGDLGYPSTVELSGGEMLTVWYEHPGDSDKAVLREVGWRL